MLVGLSGKVIGFGISFGFFLVAVMEGGFHLQLGFRGLVCHTVLASGKLLRLQIGNGEKKRTPEERGSYMQSIAMRA